MQLTRAVLLHASRPLALAAAVALTSHTAAMPPAKVSGMPGSKSAGRPASIPAKTVCTITVNSPDEKEAFRRHLPESKYRFVELVEEGRPDWLESSCRAATSCDVLVISGHFDGDNQFFSDRIEAREYLTVGEMERASCSGSCPTLFSGLKEVYLFGCNSLNPQRQSSASAYTAHEFVSNVVGNGRSQIETDLQLQMVNAAHGQSSLERMRLLFANVPVLYGFASTAPLGPVAGSTLSQYFRTQGSSRVASGRPDLGLVQAFSAFSMNRASGVTASDPRASDRADMCRFVDDRVPLAGKVDFVHELLLRPGDDAERYLDRIQRLTASLNDTVYKGPEVAAAVRRIETDQVARERFLSDAREASRAPTRVRMVHVARDLGWLTEDQSWQELALLLGQLQERKVVGIAEIDLACQLNHGGELDGAFARRIPPGSDSVAHAALRACLGSHEARDQTIAGLSGTKPENVAAAQAYLRRRPITDTDDLRDLSRQIAQMPAGDLQVRALEVLARHYVADRDVLQTLTQLYVKTPSPAVQNAVAGVLLRADRRSIDKDELLRTLMEYRKRGNGTRGEMVDALMARLDSP